MSRTSKTAPSRRAAPKRAAPRHAALRDRRSQGAAPDQIKVSVIGNRLDAISREIGQTMLRTSRSPIFSEARDFVTAIFDAQTRLVAQTAYIPVLMGALPYALRSIAKTFEGDVDDGDIFILNDPYRGNNHPPDITIAKPVFHGGKIAFWAVSKGHHADVGGGGVAGYNPGAKVIWEEGIRIPPAKLYIAGKANKALWDTILLNVHLPFLVEGDLQCQVGAVTIGERSLKTLPLRVVAPQ
jgi:N-methylhydantoinase B